ncbi:hypothetical protein [Flavobacterium sp. JP2137]|uniref:hypothetical protein n=1 Tax=Flavobacterium sp. JP2137 TaxID=3414510 RepID=UPI003D2F9CD4
MFLSLNLISQTLSLFEISEGKVTLIFIKSHLDAVYLTFRTDFNSQLLKNQGLTKTKK